MSASVYPGEHKFRLNAGDTLRVDAREKEEHLVLLEPGDPADQLIAIEIDW